MRHAAGPGEPRGTPLLGKQGRRAPQQLILATCRLRGCTGAGLQPPHGATARRPAPGQCPVAQRARNCCSACSRRPRAARDCNSLSTQRAHRPDGCARVALAVFKSGIRPRAAPLLPPPPPPPPHPLSRSLRCANTTHPLSSAGTPFQPHPPSATAPLRAVRPPPNPAFTMVSLSRALFTASVAFAAAVGTTASLQDDTAAVVHHARAFGKPAHAPRLVSRFGNQPVVRRTRRCKPKTSGSSASASDSTSSAPTTSSSSSPKGSHAPKHNTHAHSKSQTHPSSASSGSSSSYSSPSPKSSSSSTSSKHDASSKTSSSSHTSQSAKPSPSSTGGNHYATSKASSSSSSAPSPSSSSSSASDGSSSGSSGGGSGGIGGILQGAAAGSHTGDLTYYSTGLGACGWQSSDSDYIAAIGTPLWTKYGFSNSNKLCGHEISLTYNDKTIKVKAVDQCPGCAAGSLDLSPAAFKALGSEAEGRLTGATWHFVS